VEEAAKACAAMAQNLSAFHMAGGGDALAPAPNVAAPPVQNSASVTPHSRSEDRPSTNGKHVPVSIS
jgi:hypothetical protein